MATDKTKQSACPKVDYRVELPRYRRPGEPHRYRLSTAGIEACEKKPAVPPWLISFRFGTRYVSALATSFDRDRPHLLDLQIRPSRVAWFIGALVGFLPSFAQSWVRALLPEWFLPSRVVLKAEKEGNEWKDCSAQLFDNEVRAYNRVKPLQGTVVPKCYGVARYNGRRALVLERLGGVSLASPQGATLTLDELAALMQPCHRAIHAFRIHHSDPHPSNYQLVDGRLMILDLEIIEWDRPDEDNIKSMLSNIYDLAYRYKSLQRFYYRGEGWLEPA
ncbi:hypothetical protein VTH06DRAFT_5272 [Thermothelomyces fergusii]